MDYLEKLEETQKQMQAQLRKASWWFASGVFCGFLAGAAYTLWHVCSKFPGVCE